MAPLKMSKVLLGIFDNTGYPNNTNEDRSIFIQYISNMMIEKNRMFVKELSSKELSMVSYLFG